MKTLLLILFACLSTGIYSTAQTPSSENILYVNASVSGGTGTGNSWANAIRQLADALKYARTQYNANHAVYDVTPLKIYVAKGTYKPMYHASNVQFTTNGGRDNAFVMVENVQLYGGFDPANGITTLADTRLLPNSTGTGGGSILSGDIGTAGTETDNCYHIVISLWDHAILDGFTVTGAYATPSDDVPVIMYPEIGYAIYRNNGGGVFNSSNATFNNCRITGNESQYGAAMRNYGASTITNCSFIDNTATSMGGGIYASVYSPIITNCTFKQNKASLYGGAMYNFDASPIVTNCSFTVNSAVTGAGMYNTADAAPKISNSIFTGNVASSDGGGMYNTSSSQPKITNCLFSKNMAANDGSAMYVTYNSSPTITNSTIANNGSPLVNNGLYITDAGTNVIFQNTIVWENIRTASSGSYTANYSLLKNLNPAGTGNVNATFMAENDVFTNYANDEYTLKSTSVAVNAGNNPYNATTTDLAGNNRLYNSKTDIGAYEHQAFIATPDANNILYVNINVTGGTGKGNSWANAIKNLADAMKWARQENNFSSATPLKIYVAKGIYKPMYNAADGLYLIAGAATVSYTDRDNAFVMVNNVKVYGGFDPAKGVTSLANKRRFGASGSILSGEIGNINDNTDNTYHVVISANDAGNALLDGFTVRDSYSTSSYNGDIAVNNRTVNRVSGGGMYNVSSSPAIINCIFTENVSNLGGGMRNSSSSPSITNCSFTGDTAFSDGGAIYNSSSSPIITNTTIVNNGSNGIYISGSSSNLVFRNTIAWETITTASSGSYTVSYSLLKDLNPPGTGNINATSLAATAIFNDYNNGDYSLKSSSVALNKGNNAFNATSADLAGNERIYSNGIIDLGAYEYQGNPTTLPVTFGKFTAMPKSNHVKLDWNTFSETNNAGFIIYRSTDGINYTEITTQTSKGSSANSYTTFDNHPANGVNYYRLSQKDNDGTVTKLADDVVNFSLANAEVKAWPNPIAKTLNVSFTPGKYQSLRLVAITGKILLERNIASAQNETEIEMSTYSKGIYIVELKGSNGSHLVKVIK